MIGHGGHGTTKRHEDAMYKTSNQFIHVSNTVVIQTKHQLEISFQHCPRVRTPLGALKALFPSSTAPPRSDTRQMEIVTRVILPALFPHVILPNGPPM